MGPDRTTNLRNVAIIAVLAVAVWQLPGGNTGANLISSLLTIVFVGGIMFFGYKMYMENRTTLYGLDERVRIMLYGALGLLTITLVATRRMLDAGGLFILLWFCLLALGMWALVQVYRAWRAY